MTAANAELLKLHADRLEAAAGAVLAHLAEHGDPDAPEDRDLAGLLAAVLKVVTGRGRGPVWPDREGVAG